MTDDPISAEEPTFPIELVVTYVVATATSFGRRQITLRAEVTARRVADVTED